MTDDEVAAIGARAEAATAGPWEWDKNGEALVAPSVIDREYGEFGSVLAAYPRVLVMGYPCKSGTGFDDWTGPNAAFIAHARTDVPALVAEVQRLRALVAALVSEPS